MVEPAFWGTLGDWKLEELKLEEGPLQINATYTPSNHAQIPGALALSPKSLDSIPPPSDATLTSSDATTSSEASLQSRYITCQVHGQLYCLNTVERVSTFERAAATSQATSAIWDAICSGQAEEDPSLLQRMVALVYCDLKKYKYYYLFGFPVLTPPTAYTLTRPPVTATAYFESAQQAQHVTEGLWGYLNGLGHGNMPPFFLMDVKERDGEGLVTTEFHPLTSWAHLQNSTTTAAAPSTKHYTGVYVIFADPSNAMEYPGWPLRNFLLLAAVRWKVPLLRVLCLRTAKGRPNADFSLILEVKLPEIPIGFHPGPIGGWDTGLGGKSGPKVADLGSAMDPKRLAASAVALNLQLMRWRAAPTLDLSKVSDTRCLLLGAGTLGCSVARCLLGWGVKKITFVDNARVAYSNPVRQSLFTFNDCLNGGKPKAASAADAIRAIFPDAEVSGLELSIPMPGHPPPPGQVESFIQNTDTLHELVQSHDAVFLLLDTRESRWLATTMCAASGKLAITTALGFESFVVLRHGAGVPLHKITEEETHDSDINTTIDTEKDGKETVKATEKKGGKNIRLGCYFCNDVIAPANSTRDRTMDQQCTVARPGLSGIAGSLAVEVMAATLQHPLGINAPPAGHALPSGSEDSLGEEESRSDETDPPLGQVPHMIRGHLSGFSQMCLTGQAFPQCPACSAAVVEQYRRRGTEFVLQAVSQPGYLEELTGLKELQREMEEAMEALELEKEREAESGSGEDWEEL